MGHKSHHKVYSDLRTRLDQLPNTFPDSREGMELLRMLFSEEDAELVAQLPLRPTSPKRVARKTGLSVEEVTRRLDALADKGLIFDLYNEKQQRP